MVNASYVFRLTLKDNSDGSSMGRPSCSWGRPQRRRLTGKAGGNDGEPGLRRHRRHAQLRSAPFSIPVDILGFHSEQVPLNVCHKRLNGFRSTIPGIA
jgi:hypothetical protein